MSTLDITTKVRNVIKDDEKLKSEIERISLFGSQLHGTATAKSDVDLLVTFNPDAHVGLFRLVAIERLFAEKLQKKVDLVTPRALSKYFREVVLSEATPLYER